MKKHDKEEIPQQDEVTLTEDQKKERDAKEEAEAKERRSYVTSRMKEEAAKYSVNLIEGEHSEDLQRRIEAKKYGLRTYEDHVAFNRAKEEGAFEKRDNNNDGITADKVLDDAEIKQFLKPYTDKGLSVSFTEGGGELRFQGKEDSFNFGYSKEAIISAARTLVGNA